MKKMIIGTLISMLAGPFSVGAQEAQMTRLSKITVNADHLPAYRDALAEEVRASMELEPACCRCMRSLTRKIRPG